MVGRLEELLSRQPWLNTEKYPVTKVLCKDNDKAIYLSIDKTTGIASTVKVLYKKNSWNADLLSTFINEVSLIKRLKHHGVVELIDFGVNEAGFFIVTEFIEGASLWDILKTSALSLRKSIHIVIQIAEAIGYLHSNGVLHKDIKPENIMLLSDGSIKVIDFGIAQNVVLSKGLRGIVMGTPYYMSPEQRCIGASISCASDIYSLGVLLYELVTGRLSYGKIAVSLLPIGLQKIVIPMLRQDPDSRYSSIADIILELSQYMNSHQIILDVRGADLVYEAHEKSIYNLKNELKLPCSTNYKNLFFEFAQEEHEIDLNIWSELFYINENETALIILTLLSDKLSLIDLVKIKGLVSGLIKIYGSVRFIEELNKRLVDLNFPEKSVACTLITSNVNNDELSCIVCGNSNLWINESGKWVYVASKNQEISNSSISIVEEIKVSWQIVKDVVFFAVNVGENEICLTELEKNLFSFVVTKGNNLHTADMMARRCSVHLCGYSKQRLVTVIKVKKVV